MLVPLEYDSFDDLVMMVLNENKSSDSKPCVCQWREFNVYQIILCVDICLVIVRHTGFYVIYL